MLRQLHPQSDGIMAELVAGQEVECVDQVDCGVKLFIVKGFNAFDEVVKVIILKQTFFQTDHPQAARESAGSGIPRCRWPSRWSAFSSFVFGALVCRGDASGTC